MRVLALQTSSRDKLDRKRSSPPRLAQLSAHVLDSSSPPPGHEPVSHAEQVPQDIRCDAGQANQHGGVVEIVVSHVVNLRVCCEQFCAVVETNANHERTRLSRTMSGQARQKFSLNLERG